MFVHDVQIITETFSGPKNKAANVLKHCNVSHYYASICKVKKVAIMLDDQIVA
jgi:hypothetical protein